MIEIHFTLFVANCEARRAPNTQGDGEPWELTTIRSVVPQLGEWFWIPSSDFPIQPIVRARCGVPEHGRWCSQTVHITLCIDAINEEDAIAIGVRFEPEMLG